MHELTGTTLDRYGISILPKAIRFPGNPADREFCDTCGHSAIRHETKRSWHCRACPDCKEFTSPGLRQYIADKQARKTHGRSLPIETQRAVLERDGMICYYCRHRLHLRRKGPHKLHFDHLTPFSLGGTHDPENVVTCCLECNLAKHDRGEMEFWEMREMGLGCQRNLPIAEAVRSE